MPGARLREQSARARECCCDLQPAPSRLRMKMCHIPFHAPFQILFSSCFSAHLQSEQCCYFYGVRTWTCCQRSKVVFLLDLSGLPMLGQDWRLIKRADIGLGTLHTQKRKALKRLPTAPGSLGVGSWRKGMAEKMMRLIKENTVRKL